MRHSREIKYSEAITYTIIELQARIWEVCRVSVMQAFLSWVMWLIVEEDFNAFIFSESFRFVVLFCIFSVN